MKAVFADTFYWIALINPADPRYRDAVAREDELSGVTIFTTDEVLTGFVTFFAAGTRLRDAPPGPFQRCFTSRIRGSFRQAGKVSCSDGHTPNCRK